MPEANNPPWARWLPPGVTPDFDPPPATVGELFWKTVANHADLDFLEYYGEHISYGEMGRRVRDLSCSLQQAGIGRGTVVALYLPNCPWHPLWFLSVLEAGGTITHLSPLDAPRELADKIRDSGARMLVTLSSQRYMQRAGELLKGGALDLVILCRDAQSLEGGPHNVPDGMLAHEDFVHSHRHGAFRDPELLPDDLALLQYTGGTTGQPKAAMLTHRNLTASALIYSEWFRREPQSGPGKSVLVYSPLFHILGLNTTLLRRMAEGGTLYLRQRFDAAEAVDLIEKHRIVSFGGVPTTWIAITQLPGIDRRDLSSLQYAGSGGAPLSVELYRRVRNLTGLNLRGGWGMTETSPAGTNIPVDLPEDKLATIGIPLPGVRIEIVDVENPRSVLPPGEVGEMRIRGPNVTSSYWNRPEETEAAFIDGWLLTGDLAWMDNDGFFYIVDRKKDLIVSSGFNVYPLVVEKAILEHPDVVEAMVIGVPDPYRGESAKAFICLGRGAKPFSLAELQDFLKMRIGPHEMPRELEFRDALPRTGVGKQSRRELRAQELAARSIAAHRSES